MQSCDYYSILQVHYLAEPEVIESAYKRLARKYHPDVNKSKDSGNRMRLLNEAYEILKNSETRKEYDEYLMEAEKLASVAGESVENSGSSYSAPQKVLEDYFRFLRDKDFDKAYEALSAEDKARISYQDFIKWQGAVTRIYRLLDYECQPCSRERDMTLRGFLYKEVCGFTVVTVEKNLLMNRLEKDVVNKRVVLEASRWRIHTGYEDIRPLTARFEELGGLLEARNVIGDMLELYGNKDSRTGLLNKKGFIEAAEREAWRYERYGNSFSLALFELDCPEHLVERCAAILGNSIRKTDIAGRWSETGFMLLLPETGIRDGLNAVMKLKAALDKAMAPEKGTNKKSNIRIGIEEFKGSMEHTLGKLQNKIGTADS